MRKEDHKKKQRGVFGESVGIGAGSLGGNLGGLEHSSAFSSRLASAYFSGVSYGGGYEYGPGSADIGLDDTNSISGGYLGGLGIGSVGLGAVSTGLDARSIGFGTGSIGLGAQSIGLGVASSGPIELGRSI